MLRMISLILCLLMAACYAPVNTVSDDLDTQKDLSPTDVEDDMFLNTLEGIHDVDPFSLLPVSPITWDTCSGVEGDHPCNIIAPDQREDNFGLYAEFGRPIVLDFSTGWCGPCRAAAQHAEAVQEAFSAHDVLYVTVLIETADGSVPVQADITQWAQEYDLENSLVIGGSRALLESSGGPWPLSGWPTFYYIDRNMVLRDIDRGYNANEIEHSLNWLVTL